MEETHANNGKASIRPTRTGYALVVEGHDSQGFYFSGHLSFTPEQFTHFLDGITNVVSKTERGRALGVKEGLIHTHFGESLNSSCPACQKLLEEAAKL